MAIGDETIKYEDIENKYGDVLAFSLPGVSAAVIGNYSTYTNIMRPMEIMLVSVSFSTASISGTLQLEKLTGTTAPGAGSNILTTAFSLSSTANTVTTKITRDMTASRVFKQGDRLALKGAGTLTNALNLAVTIYYKPLGRGDFR